MELEINESFSKLTSTPEKKVKPTGDPEKKKKPTGEKSKNADEETEPTPFDRREPESEYLQYLSSSWPATKAIDDEIKEVMSFPIEDDLQKLYGPFRRYVLNQLPTVKEARTPEPILSSIRGVFRIFKACKWETDKLSEYGLTGTDRKRLAAVQEVNKPNLTLADALAKAPKQPEKARNGKKKKNFNNAVKMAMRFDYVDPRELLLRLLAARPGEITVDEAKAFTCDVASIFLYMFPLRASTVSVMPLTTLVPYNIEHIKVPTGFDRNKWDPLRDTSDKRSHDSQAFVVVYQHVDPKRGEKYLRAYPSWVHAILLLYHKKVRYNEISNYIFPFEDAKIKVAQYVSDHYIATRGMRQWMRDYLATDSDFPAKVPTNALDAAIRATLIPNANDARTMYETAIKKRKETAELLRDDPDFNREHVASTVEKHYIACEGAYPAYMELLQYLDGLQELHIDAKIEKDYWDDLIDPYLVWLKYIASYQYKELRKKREKERREQAKRSSSASN